MSLAAFFDAVVPALRGESGTPPLGPTTPPSGLALYARLVRGDLHEALRRGQQGTARAAERVRPGLFGELAEGYLRAHPPSHWDPGRIGVHFSAFLRERQSDLVPGFLADLADLHARLYDVAVAPDVPLGEALDVSLIVRRYETTAPRFWLTLDEEPPPPMPWVEDTLVVVYRSYATRQPSVFFPSIAGLQVLAQRCAGRQLPELATADPVAARAQAQALEALERHGVLPRPSPPPDTDAPAELR